MINTKNLFVAALGLLVLACPAEAKNLKKQSLKDLRKASQQRAKAFKKTLKAELSQLFISLDILDRKLRSGAGSVADVTALFNELNSFQLDVRSEMKAASDDITFFLQHEMQDLEAGNIHVDEYPKGFFYGEGGAMDDYRARLLKELDKTYASVLKRVRNSGKLFGSKLNRSLTVRLAHPTDLRERACRAGATSSNTAPNARTVDLILGTSDLSQSNDAQILVAGSAQYSRPLRVRLVRGAGSLTTSTSSNSSARWSHTYNSYEEGNFTLQIMDDTSIDGIAIHAIGVR